MHARLFEHAGALEHADLLGHAAALQLDEAQFETCLAGETSAAVNKDLEEGKRLGVRGTPSFFIGAIEDDGSILLTRSSYWCDDSGGGGSWTGGGFYCSYPDAWSCQ